MTELLLAANPGPAGELVWAAPQWQVLLAVALALVAWGVAWLGQRPLRQRLIEVALWGLALALVVVALARPVWVEESGRTEAARLAVLVDASRSMSVLEGGEPRSTRALELLDKLDAADVDVYHFGEELHVGRPVSFDDSGSDLEGALASLRERVAGERLAGVVLLTDGLDRGLLRKRLRNGGTELPELAGPLTVYQVGTPGELRDLSVQEVHAGGFAFKNSPFTLTAELAGPGYEGRIVPVSLTRDGAPVKTIRTTIEADGTGSAAFTITPSEVGRFTYQVSVPTFDDDAVVGNNAAPVVVRVVRDRVRVLQVTGSPSSDVKFLRRFLKGDPAVDLVSFFILRTPQDLNAPYREEELALIEFPYRQLFAEDLKTFDLVIFQNFDYDAYFRGRRQSMELLGNIRRFVAEQGGGFAMVGGDRSFDLGNYQQTPVGEMLPVELGVGEPRSTKEPFQPVLTGEGARHPVTLLIGDPAENAAWWQRLVPLDGVNRVRGANVSSTTLLEHPVLTSSDGERLPVLAVREFGNGRTMAFTADSSWRWSLSEAAEGRGNQAYLRFWKNAMRWLIKDPSMQRVRVDTPKENYAVGDTVRVVVKALDPGFSALPDAEVEVELSTPEGTSTHFATTGLDGEAVVELPAEVRGAHQIDAVVRQGAVTVGGAHTVYAVTSRDPELEEVSPDRDFLEQLVLLANGRYVAPGRFEQPLRDADAGRVVVDRRETELGRAPLLALLIGLFAGAAWWIRRRAGLR